MIALQVKCRKEKIKNTTAATHELLGRSRFTCWAPAVPRVAHHTSKENVAMPSEAPPATIKFLPSPKSTHFKPNARPSDELDFLLKLTRILLYDICNPQNIQNTFELVAMIHFDLFYKVDLPLHGKVLSQKKNVPPTKPTNILSRHNS